MFLPVPGRRADRQPAPPVRLSANCADRSRSEIQTQVHARIAEASEQAHRIMEACLKDVLELEGWDMATLEMPAGLRTLLEQEIDGD